MKKLMITAAFSFALLALPAVVSAQNPAEGGKQTPPSPPAAAKPAEQTVSLDLRDAPLRQALEQLFTQAKVDFVIDPAVRGYATLKITDQTFETALRFLLRASAQPLLYAKEDGVYIVKPRVLASRLASSDVSPAAPETVPVARSSSQWEVILLTYLDPADLAGLFDITTVPTGGGRGSGAAAGAAGRGNGSSGGSTNTGGGTGFPGLGGGLGFTGGGTGLLGLSGGSGPNGGGGSRIIAPPGSSGFPGGPR